MLNESIVTHAPNRPREEIPPRPDGVDCTPIPYPRWSWGRRVVWLACPTPLTDAERAEMKELIELGDRMLAAGLGVRDAS